MSAKSVTELESIVADDYWPPEVSGDVVSVLGNQRRRFRLWMENPTDRWRAVYRLAVGLDKVIAVTFTPMSQMRMNEHTPLW
jgi:hypothetical protein